MVRLKEADPVVLGQEVQVSIPYGSIKSRPQFATWRYWIVSIPYGSIKSDIHKLGQVNISFVSIPYGSIKSQSDQCDKAHDYKVSIPYGSIKSSLTLE